MTTYGHSPARYVVTSAPEAYDYAHSKRVGHAGVFCGKQLDLVLIQPFDRLDYLFDYQVGRYDSGLNVTMTIEKFWKFVAEGMIEEIGTVPEVADCEVPMMPEFHIIDMGTMETTFRITCPVCRRRFDWTYQEIPRDPETGYPVEADVAEMIQSDWLAGDGSECGCGGAE